MSRFAQDTAVEQLGENRWRAEIKQGWRIGAVPNGGYVMAIAGRVLSEALTHKDPLSVNAFYLAPTVLGEVDCHVERLRTGRSTSYASLKMFQEGELKLQVTAAYSDLAGLSGESWSAQQRPVFPPWEECTPTGQEKPEFNREAVEIRLVSGAEVFSKREPNGSGEFQGWIQHRDGADPDPISLLMFADGFSPPSFTIFGPIRWVPTIELTVQVRALPAPGPLQARLCSRHLTRGVIEEDGEYWDSTGALVALSRQTAKLRLDKPRR